MRAQRLWENHFRSGSSNRMLERATTQEKILIEGERRQAEWDPIRLRRGSAT